MGPSVCQGSAFAFIVYLFILKSFVTANHVEVEHAHGYGNDVVNVTCQLDPEDAKKYMEVNTIKLFSGSGDLLGRVLHCTSRTQVLAEQDYKCDGGIYDGTDLGKSFLKVWPVSGKQGDMYECRYDVVMLDGRKMLLEAMGYYDSAFELDFEIETDPPMVNGRVPNAMNFTCRVTGDSFRHIGSLQVIGLHMQTGDRETRVIIDSTGDITTSSKDYRVETDGHLHSTAIKGSYLTVRLYNIEQNGVYSCDVAFTNPIGQTIARNQPGIISVNNSAMTHELFISGFQVARRQMAFLQSDLKVARQEHDAQMAAQKALYQQRKEGYDVSVARLKTRMSDNAKKLETKRKRDNTTVMFDARQGQTDFLDLGGKPIIYTQVKSNQGQGYDPLSGYFTAPVGGFYTFYFTIFVSKAAFIYVDLMIDFGEEHHTLTTVVAGAQDNWRQFVDGSTVTGMLEGERVYLTVRKSGGKNDTKAFCDDEEGGYRNRFEGYLLRPY